MGIKLYERNPELSVCAAVSKHKYIGEKNGEFIFDEIIKIEDQLYCCVRTSVKDNEYVNALLDPITFQKNDHCEELETYEDAWTCPLCGYEDYESYELADSSDDYKCPVCRATTEYEVEHIAKYTVKLIKAPEIKEV